MTQTVRLKDDREVEIRPLTTEDNEKIHEMFASMSEEALRWGMPPYTRERIERWMRNIENLIILGAEHDKLLIGYAHIARAPSLGELAQQASPSTSTRTTKAPASGRR
jgi:hypothetical protein